MKFPRTIRFDVSDANVFLLAAEPDEWAVTGTFTFADADPSGFTNKEQLAQTYQVFFINMASLPFA